MIQIIADTHIPYLQGLLDTVAEIRYLAPAEITAAAVRDADALLVRTRTRCDAALLAGSRVQFIATATIGYDHIDTDYCAQQGIVWHNAPGCNATSVAQYVVASLARVALQQMRPINSFTVGIVGVGHVGRAVDTYCRCMGMRTLLNDPPRAAVEGTGEFVSLEEIADTCDVITLHTPLTRNGTSPTYHLVNRELLERLKHTPVFINAARGEVVDTEALVTAHHNGRVGPLIIDCWEGEPHISPALLEAAYIATPHIAGYSADGKAHATRMAVEHLCKHFDFTPPDYLLPAAAPHPVIDLQSLPTPQEIYAILSTYDPTEDTQRLESHPANFEEQRSSYPLRREFEAYMLRGGTTGDTLPYFSLPHYLEQVKADDYSKAIGNAIIAHEAYAEAMQLALTDQEKLSFRAAWGLEYIATHHRACFLPYAAQFWHDILRVTNESVRRHYGKIAYLLLERQAYPLTPDTAERVAETIIDWLIQPQTKVAVKVWCIKLLICLTPTLPWVSKVLQQVIEREMIHPTPALRSCIKKIKKRV